MLLNNSLKFTHIDSVKISIKKHCDELTRTANTRAIKQLKNIRLFFCESTGESIQNSIYSKSIDTRSLFAAKKSKYEYDLMIVFVSYHRNEIVNSMNDSSTSRGAFGTGPSCPRSLAARPLVEPVWTQQHDGLSIPRRRKHGPN